MVALLRWKFWHWTLLSIALGAGLVYCDGEHDFAPRDRTARVELQFFANQVHGKPFPNGQVRASAITLYPMHDGVQLVTFTSAEADMFGRPALVHRFFYTDHTNVADRLGQLGVPYGYAWWALPVWGKLLWGGGSVLVVGIIWPLLLWSLKRAGLGPKIEPAYNFKRFASEPEKAVPKSVVTDATLARVRELDASLEAALMQGASTSVAAEKPKTPAAARQLDAPPLESPVPETPGEEKHYEGQFYPVARPTGKTPQGFSLVELLVVIGIIGVLLAILLPALRGAREAANQIACAANLRSIGQGLFAYVAQNDGAFPPAYVYVGETVNNGVETGSSDAGYVHWSYYLYSNLGTALSAFQCPSLERGGLPPANATADDLDPGQVVAAAGIVDQQPPRLAYTVNEAICPRNKFVLGFQGAVRIYQYVKASQISNASQTILATEFGPDAARFAAVSGGGFYTYSHRPISGFVASNGTIEMYTLAPDAGFRQAIAADLDPDPATGSYATVCLLNWVGRNHGARTNYPDRRRSNFLYVDGHVETKTIYETLSPFQWGSKFWSLNPNGDL